MQYRSVLAALTILVTRVPPAVAEPSGGGVPGVSDVSAPRATLEVVLPGATQALLRDRATGEYQLVRVGDWYQGFQIRGIDREHIVLSALTGSFHVLSLAAGAAAATAAPTAVPLPTDGAVDPYGESAAGPSFAPENPYGSETAPEDPYGAEAAPPVPAAPAPAAPAPIIPPPTERVSPLGGDPSPAPTVAPGPTAPAPAGETVRIVRADFDAALSDFPARSKEIQIAVETGGIRLRAVSRGTIFERLGLRQGDLVRSIAGNRVLSIDDAAPVYARLLSADSFVIEVERAGARIDLRVELIRNR